MRIQLTFNSLRQMIDGCALSKQIREAEVPVVYGVIDKPIGTAKLMIAEDGSVIAELHLDKEHRLFGPSPIRDFFPQEVPHE